MSAQYRKLSHSSLSTMPAKHDSPNYNALHATVIPSNVHSERNSLSAATGLRGELQASGSPWPTHHDT